MSGIAGIIGTRDSIFRKEPFVRDLPEKAFETGQTLFLYNGCRLAWFFSASFGSYRYKSPSTFRLNRTKKKAKAPKCLRRASFYDLPA